MANAVSIPNPTKELLRAGKVALGMNVRLARSGDIARIAKSTDHDFIFIDVQHSMYNVETIGHIAQAALGVGVSPLVRVRSCDDPGHAGAARQRRYRHRLSRRQHRRRSEARRESREVSAAQAGARSAAAIRYSTTGR